MSTIPVLMKCNLKDFLTKLNENVLFILLVSIDNVTRTNSSNTEILPSPLPIKSRDVHSGSPGRHCISSLNIIKSNC